MNASGGICGFLEDEENLPDGIRSQPCQEPTWDERDHCLWHAKVDNKPVDQLANAWPDAPNRIDGIYLDNTELGDRIGFNDRTLYAGSFCDADLSEADFRNATLDKSDFTEAKLRSARFNTNETSLRAVCFNEATIIGARFQQSILHKSDFTKANGSSARFQYADAAEAIFNSSNLNDSSFIHTNLRSADLEGASLSKADFGNANLEKASLNEADLRSTSLVDTDLYEVDFRDADVDHRTDFGTQICREFSADRTAESTRVKQWTQLPDEACSNSSPDIDSDSDYPEDYHSEKEQYLNSLKRHQLLISSLTRLKNRFRVPKQDDDQREMLSEAEQIYRDIKQLFRENPVPEQRRHFNIREKEIKRKRAYLKSSPSWLRWVSLRWTMMYGESVKQVFVASIGVIFFSAMLYPIWGLGFESGPTVKYSIPGTLNPDWILTFIFYSLRRLIGPTNGNINPVGVSEWIALAESTVGALLIAMLVFVLGRKATS
ncbi:pentapeptide repeat-containing protein [Haloarcula sp. JP-L23]|uniref:pentapeptide repeat-containing protein n=1 Tax=Haloarcula sp. JP-L23 TaxID=2716717 RepID=UPI00140E9BB1|nr:pentapeptide repeat-containing protein [Haloarcula sp. JP-L23]